MARRRRKKRALNPEEIQERYPNEKYISNYSPKSGLKAIAIVLLVIIVSSFFLYSTGVIKPVLYSSEQQKALEAQQRNPENAGGLRYK